MNTKHLVEKRKNAIPQTGPNGCSILATIELIGDRWTLGILRCVMYGHRRFSDVQRELGIATNILTERLRALVDSGLLERVQYSQRPPRFEYALTEEARELIPAFLLFKSWGDRHLRGDVGPAAALVHRPCGHHLEPELVCRHCREPVDPNELGIEWLR